MDLNQSDVFSPPMGGIPPVFRFSVNTNRHNGGIGPKKTSRKGSSLFQVPVQPRTLSRHIQHLIDIHHQRQLLRHIAIQQPYPTAFHQVDYQDSSIGERLPVLRQPRLEHQHQLLNIILQHPYIDKPPFFLGHPYPSLFRLASRQQTYQGFKSTLASEGSLPAMQPASEAGVAHNFALDHPPRPQSHHIFTGGRGGPPPSYAPFRASPPNSVKALEGSNDLLEMVINIISIITGILSTFLRHPYDILPWRFSPSHSTFTYLPGSGGLTNDPWPRLQSAASEPSTQGAITRVHTGVRLPPPGRLDPGWSRRFSTRPASGPIQPTCHGVADDDDDIYTAFLADHP
ncbi:hypothetical protein CONLIGDRAFT_717718 [Coniochaeta ligniaria NRRL 30616]|uniref:Uncharacterized protein n=1 Tax=Coniochaeta ligniaria NRRL 30616 TaxID=1408157 RepID=A0A1J7J8G9_9PEZI|nr:hypothetical protein CONLIGDRAFT_717718 [Coniochaeta ligniaria NRRL 30616]